MDSRPWLSLLKRWLCEWLTVAALGIALDRWSNPDNPTAIPLAALVSIAILVVVQMALGLVSLLAGFLYLWLLKGDDLEMIVLEDLRRNKVPPPSRHQSKRWDYLSEIIEDDAAAPRDRIRAAALTSGYAVVFQRAGFIGRIAWTEAADKAVVRYAGETPEK